MSCVSVVMTLFSLLKLSVTDSHIFCFFSVMGKEAAEGLSTH